MKIDGALTPIINKFNSIANPVKFTNIFSSLVSKPETNNFALSNAKSLIEDVKKSLSSTGEVSSNALTNEKSNLIDLVTTLSETEAKLKILINVRDSLVSSMQEIMRMQI